MIHCLHGFLGRPSDWDILPFPHHAPDLHAGPPLPMAEWGRRFNESTRDGDILIGYSLGGRLAVHALLEAACGPRNYAGAVIVSSGLGIADEADRGARVARDEQWALRFENEDWDTVLADWNAQPLFGGHEIRRREADYERSRLAAALRTWSPAAHAPLESRLAEIEVPVLWVAGERDARYVEVARRAATRLSDAKMWIAPESGHRVPWERTRQFVEKISFFLES